LKEAKMAGTNEFNEIKLYMESGTFDYYYDKFSEVEGVLLWVDHRDSDEDIINGVESILKTGCLKGETVNETNDKIGFEVLIHYKGEKHKIEYKGEGSDRDTTIIFLNEILKPDYEIRICKHSLGNDTLTFLPLPKIQWEELEKEFGQNMVDLFFMKISKNSEIFTLDMKEIHKIEIEMENEEKARLGK
jgi:hypothetical protein